LDPGGHESGVGAPAGGSPDDLKLVSSLTLFAGVAAALEDTDSWYRFVEQANEILDEAETQQLPRCIVTQRFLASSDARPRDGAAA
jgi:hypothetical protein